MKLLDGTPEEIAKFLELTEGSVKIADPVDIYRTPKTVLDYIEATKGPRMPLSQKDETRLPSEGRSSRLGHSSKLSDESKRKIKALIEDCLEAGGDWHVIQTALDEEGIYLADRQLHGWIGLIKKGMKASQMTKDAPKAELEGNCLSQAKDAAKDHTTNPKSKELDLSQIKRIKAMYNKDQLRPEHIAKRMGISQEQVEAIVWEVKG